MTGVTVTVDVVLPLLGIGTEAILIALVLRKRAFRSFPVFCAYLIWDLIDGIGLYTTSHLFPTQFFRIFLIALVIDSIFVFAVLVEVSWSVLRPLRSALPRWAILVVALLVGAAGAAVWPFAHSAVYASYGPQSRLLIHLQQTASIVRILFFLVLAACSQLLSINWRDREMQIATGLGFFSIVTVGVSILQAGLAPGSLYHLLDMAVVSADIVTILYWTYSFAKEPAPRREFTPQMQSFLLAMAGSARSTRIVLADTQSQNSRRKDLK